MEIVLEATVNSTRPNACSIVGEVTMKTHACYLIVGVTVVGLFVLPVGSQDSPSMRDIYKYVWDFVIVGDREATDEDLEVFHNYFSAQPSETKAQVEKTIRSDALGEREKRQAIRENLKGTRNGSVVTKRGETLHGIVQNRMGESRWSTIFVRLQNGGTVDIPIEDIVEAKYNGQESSVKTRQGTIYRGEIAPSHNVGVYTKEKNPIVVQYSQIDKVILGSVKQVRCPNCMRVMEIDWKYCPYDGKQLGGSEK
jgi:hypothetical protein